MQFFLILRVSVLKINILTGATIRFLSNYTTMITDDHNPAPQKENGGHNSVLFFYICNRLLLQISTAI